MRIGILLTRPRSEERRLAEALTARGVDVVQLPDRAVAFDLHSRGYADLDLVVDRCDDYTMAQTALRMLEHLGVRTVNRPATVDLCGNKALMTTTLIRSGVPTLKTEVALGTDAALGAIERLGYPTVIKPLVGDNSQLLALIEDREAAEAVLEHKAMLGTDRHHVYYLQEFVRKPGRDIHVLVIGAQPLVAEYRESANWITSRDRHARATPCPLTPDLVDLAKRAAAAFGGGILEIDLLETNDGLLVNEVGVIDEFRSFEKAGVNVAEAITDYLIDVIDIATATNGRITPGSANVRG